MPSTTCRCGNKRRLRRRRPRAAFEHSDRTGGGETDAAPAASNGTSAPSPRRPATNGRPGANVGNGTNGTSGASGSNGGAPVGARATRKVGRNDPCPCGSGKKFKRCHGA